MIIGILTELAATATLILTIGDGHAWLLLGLSVIGTVTATAITVIAKLFGVDEKSLKAYFDKIGKVLVDKDCDGVPGCLDADDNDPNVT